jgi:hypothetical protein
MAVAEQTGVKPYRFLTDLSHGWLEVPIREVQELGIDSMLTNGSKVNQDAVYLEDVHDAQIFIRAQENHGQKLKIIPYHTSQSEINHFRPYK